MLSSKNTTAGKTAQKQVTTLTFSLTDTSVRVQSVNGTLWFVAKDVCNALNITWSGATLAQIPSEWKGVMKFNTPGGNQELTTISEAGMYKLAFRCNSSAVADAFTNWVAGEVLPTIRRTGGYGAGQASDRDVIRAAARIAGGQAALSRFLGIGESTISEVVNGSGRPSGDMVRFVVETCRRIVALGATDGVQVCRPESICRPERYKPPKGDRLTRLLALVARVESSAVRNGILDELLEGGAR